MSTTRCSPLAVRLLPLAALAGSIALVVGATPASADSGWWYSNGRGAKGYFTRVGDTITACDIRTDGYKALVQILTVNDSLVTRAADDLNNGKCTPTTFDLIDGSHYQIQVCVVKNGQRPRNCSTPREFLA
ncbi:hypothetical protein ACWD25_19610 [Streptomyces sp. NPDC002920]